MYFMTPLGGVVSGSAVTRNLQGGCTIYLVC